MRSSLLSCGMALALWGGSSLLAADPVTPPPAGVEKESSGTEKPSTEKPGPGPLDLDDVPEPLVPKKARTVAEADHLESKALFAAGRLHEQREQYAQALKFYQRALRYDEDSLIILRQIVPLAFNLDRTGEAVRYALKAVELDPSDQMLLRRLGAHLVQTGDLAGALRLFERAVTGPNVDKKSAGYIALRAQMGELYYLSEKYKEAAECFDTVQEAVKKPDDFGLNEQISKLLVGEKAQTYERFGQAYLKAGQTEKAIAAFQVAQEAAPNKGLHALHMAQVYAKTGDHAKALAELEDFFRHQLSGQGDAPYELLAVILKGLDKQDEYLERLERLRKSDPGNVQLGYFLAKQYQQAEKTAEAEKLFVELLQLKAEPAGFAGLAQIYRKRQDWMPLLKVLGQSAEAGEDAELLRTLLEKLGPEGQAVAKDKELSAALLKAAQDQYAKNPADLTYGMRLAVAYVAVESKQFDVAEQFFQRALEVNTGEKLTFYQEWGLTLVLAEQYEAAAKVFQAALDAKLPEPGDPTLLYHLSGAQEMAGQTDAALATAKAALKMREDLPILHRRVAWVLYHARRYPEAIKAYNALVEKFAGTETAKESRLVLSNIYVINKDLPKAEELLEQVLDEYPDDVAASNDLGYLWADQGKHLERALRMCRLAVDSNPTNEAYRDSLGWVLYKLGRYPEALVEMEKATGGEDPDAVLLDHLGDVQLQAKGPAAAVASWKRALAAYEKAVPRETDKIEQVLQKIRLHEPAAGTPRLEPAKPETP